jgi:hypothetical protein
MILDVPARRHVKIDVVKAALFIGIVLALTPVFAQERAAKASAKIDVACIQNAIDTRDTALANMVSDWSSSTGNALQARREALKDSWSIIDYKKRRLAQRTAWSEYRKLLRSANSSKAKERSRSWKKFEQDRRQCEGAYSPEMITGSTYDANL